MPRLGVDEGITSEWVPSSNVLSVCGSILGTFLSSLATGTWGKSWLPTWDLLPPVVGLLCSLSLQVVLLITGQLRRWTPRAKLPAWVAYVGSDLVAAYTLGLLCRSQQHVGLYGLWAALLVYHLGGPDNFTAYERADSELWKRHAVNLLIQVGSALYVIYKDSRGWILVPTLLVFLVGFIRYCERTLALMHSSSAGITEAMTGLYKYMENEGEPSPELGKLNYIVAGAKHWHSTMKRLAAPTGRFDVVESYRESRPGLVTTSDIEVVLDLPADIAKWAQWLVVASASSSAYLRRVVGLARLEQLLAKGGTQLRRKWFGECLKLEDWMNYMQLEQEFLYTLLYTKPTDPNGNLPRFMIRIISSFALMGSLLAVYFLAGDETWQEYIIYQLATNVVLLVGVIVEFGYVLRLFFSKGAVIAMLVHLVKARQAKGLKLFFPVKQFVCVWLLRINKWWETRIIVIHKQTYVPGSGWEKRCKAKRWPLRTIEAYIPRFTSSNGERSWEMVRMATPEGRDCTTLLHKIEESQRDGVISVLKSIRDLTALPPDRSRAEVWLQTAPVPFWSRRDSDPFRSFYNSDWEHVLLIWLIATLKVLCLQERSLMIGVPITCQYEPIELRAVAEVCSKRENKVVEVECNAQTTQMEAIWLMLYICHLLTVSTELLPTHLELTKKLVAENLAIAREEICDPSDWVKKIIHERWAAISSADVPKASSQLALILMMDRDAVQRWDIVKRSACYFIAALAQAAKLNQHCSKLTEGGELLTTLWILSSHLGGGEQY